MSRSATSQSATHFLFILLSFILTGCSEPPRTGNNPPKDPVLPPAPVTGRFAFQRMYIQARTWAPDVQPLRLSSFNLKQVASVAGKCGAWQATFVSPQKSKARIYTFSVVESGDVHEGVLAGREESWSGPRGQERPFFPQALKVDSDEAFATGPKELGLHKEKSGHGCPLPARIHTSFSESHLASYLGG